MIEGLIALVIYLAVISLILWLLLYVVNSLPGLEPFRSVARVFITVIGALVLIYLLIGFLGSGPPKLPRLS